MKKFSVAVLFALLIIGTAAAKPLNTIQAGPGIAVVETQSGTVQGYVHNGVYTYHGIPYATAERFAEPKPVAKWDGIRPALVWGDMAPQDTSRENDMFPSHWNWPYWEPHVLPMSENCLNLNVWTNGINDGKKRPVMGGFAMSYHCSEIPFVFNNIDLTLTATGGSKEARKLANTISSAWVNFARTGSPDAKGLPKWEPYTTEKGATMILDNKSAVGYHHDAELLDLLK